MPKSTQKDSLNQYIHDGKKRANNPPVGLVTSETDNTDKKKTYNFDPHLDPQLQWAGKSEGVSFDVVSLHVHERIDPSTIIESVRKKESTKQTELSFLFETPEENPPLRTAIEFYKHPHGWSNRLIAGDSLLVMNSLLEKEGMAGKVQMIYIDPPYGIKYGSNFQPFVNKRDVKDGKDEDLTQEPETIKAFRDTWELGIHSYLTYLRNRLLLARELLTESGSCFVQISDENVHLVRCLMDEVFGVGNFVSLINFQKTGGLQGKLLSRTVDYIIWYGKNKENIKYHQLFLKREIGDTSLDRYNYIELENEKSRRLTKNELTCLEKVPIEKRFRAVSLFSQGENEKSRFEFEFKGIKQKPISGRSWATGIEGLEKLKKAGRLILEGNTIRYKRYADDFLYIPIVERWESIQIGTSLIYVVQTSTKVIERCILMTTDPGDLVLDPTCGSGTTAYVAEQWGRRWITCDTSRVAITLSKQRLMTALFDYYELAHPKDGVSGGFNYKTVPHITLGSIANNEPPAQETLYDQPIIDKSKNRVTGPFTVEAVPFHRVISFDEVEKTSQEPDISIARSGETVKQNDWIDEMLASGIRGKNGQIIEFIRIETLKGTQFLHAEAETKDGQKAVIFFGSEYAPLEQRQVEQAIKESQELVPTPKIIIFASFQFDPEAAKDIDELKWGGVTILKVQMNTDLFTSDLKKKRASNESFWLVGQPDIELKTLDKKYIVKVNGFDYFNTKTGKVESGNISQIAMWELDTDYDGRSLYPRQVFFPLAGEKEGWSRLKKALKAQIDEELIEKYKGNTSLPFNIGKNKQIAIKLIDDRGIESMKIIKVKA